MDGADVGMIQRRGGLSLALEAGQCLGVFSDSIGQKLQRNETAKSCVLRLVDHTHPAAAQFLDNAVVRDGLADHVGPITGANLTFAKRAESMKACEFRSVWEGSLARIRQDSVGDLGGSS